MPFPEDFKDYIPRKHMQEDEFRKYAYGDWPTASGSPFPAHWQEFKFIPPKIDITDAVDIDALWKKMYERAMSVIVICTYCTVPQTIDNGTCMECGAPLPAPQPIR